MLERIIFIVGLLLILIQVLKHLSKGDLGIHLVLAGATAYLSVLFVFQWFGFNLKDLFLWFFGKPSNLIEQFFKPILLMREIVR